MKNGRDRKVTRCINKIPSFIGMDRRNHQQYKTVKVDQVGDTVITMSYQRSYDDMHQNLKFKKSQRYLKWQT